MKKTINSKDLKKILNAFARDLINYCARVEGDEIVLPEKELSNWIDAYVKAWQRKEGGDETI